MLKRRDRAYQGLPVEAAKNRHRPAMERVMERREFGQMPWSANDAERHTHKATTSELQELWAKIANECLDRTGDEGRAIREANAVIARRAETSQ